MEGDNVFSKIIHPFDNKTGRLISFGSIYLNPSFYELTKEKVKEHIYAYYYIIDNFPRLLITHTMYVESGI